MAKIWVLPYSIGFRLDLWSRASQTRSRECLDVMETCFAIQVPPIHPWEWEPKFKLQRSHVLLKSNIIRSIKGNLQIRIMPGVFRASNTSKQLTCMIMA